MRRGQRLDVALRRVERRPRVSDRFLRGLMRVR